MTAKRQFHRHAPAKGLPLYWILIAYLAIGWAWPAIGLLALICMIGPVAFSVRKGRWWCGNVCPRGSLYDRLLSKYSPHRPIPALVRRPAFRAAMVAFIFAMFGVQMHSAWGDTSAMGKVFWNIILATTVVGVALSFVYAPRTWCSFCPMGTLSAWVAPRKAPLPKGYRSIRVSGSCNAKCKNCARVCPMQLAPYASRGQAAGYLHADCIKCGKCVAACPLGATELAAKG